MVVWANSINTRNRTVLCSSHALLRYAERRLPNATILLSWSRAALAPTLTPWRSPLTTRPTTRATRTTVTVRDAPHPARVARKSSRDGGPPPCCGEKSVVGRPAAAFARFELFAAARTGIATTRIHRAWHRGGVTARDVPAIASRPSRGRRLRRAVARFFSFLGFCSPSHFFPLRAQASRSRRSTRSARSRVWTPSSCATSGTARSTSRRRESDRGMAQWVVSGGVGRRRRSRGADFSRLDLSRGEGLSPHV
jgi:hypothetical protein